MKAVFPTVLIYELKLNRCSVSMEDLVSYENLMKKLENLTEMIYRNHLV